MICVGDSPSCFWNGNKKLGMSVGLKAIDRCIEPAKVYGIAQVSVANYFHYL